MARFEISGFEAAEKELLRRREKVEPTVKRMVTEGGDVMVDGQKATISQMDLIDTGDLQGSIKATKPKSKGSAIYVEVYPHGTDRKGVRNALKGAVLEYGKSSMPAKPWMTNANNKYGPKAQEKMRDVWMEEMSDG